MSDDVIQLTSNNVFILGLQVLKFCFDCLKASILRSEKPWRKDGVILNHFIVMRIKHFRKMPTINAIWYLLLLKNSNSKKSAGVHVACQSGPAVFLPRLSTLVSPEDSRTRCMVSSRWKIRFLRSHSKQQWNRQKLRVLAVPQGKRYLSGKK